MYTSIANANEPDLSVRVTSEKTIRGRDCIFSNLERARFDIDGDDLALVTFFDLGTNLSLVYIIATSSELFFVIPRLTHTHSFPPMALQRFRQHFHQVLRAFAGEVFDLLSAGDTGGDDVEVTVSGFHFGLHRWKQPA